MPPSFGAACVLVVETDALSARAVSEAVRRLGAQAIEVAGRTEAGALVRSAEQVVAAIVAGDGPDDPGGLRMLSELRAVAPSVPIVVAAGFGRTREAVAAMKAGALYYLERPLDLDLLVMSLREAFESRPGLPEIVPARRLAGLQGRCLLGVSPSIQRTLEQALAVADLDTSVLIAGETGTGKELLAEFIHAQSRRRTGPLVTINCAALPETLLESELFGHERGAFTGAIGRKPGKFELADGGTLLLDEVGELALSLQAKVLRAIENKVVEPLGSTRQLPIDVRIIAATNRHLMELVHDGRFREDLYYRLRVFPLTLPPLRDRREDVTVLAVHFLHDYARSYRKPARTFTPAALEALKAHHWPGNVRELRHTVERAVIIATGPSIDLAHLHWTQEPGERSGREATPAGPLSYEALRRLEQEAVLSALADSAGNRTRAARALGLTRNQIRYRLRKLGVDQRH